MNVQDYSVTELFGCRPGYPLNKNLCPPGQGFHNGIDYGCPSGTPIVVNGVTIGISGATGAVTGPHVHVGRWVNGIATNPGVGNGFKFSSAVVTEINQDNVNGKYVRLQAEGASWVYLHMSDNTKVKVGQVLQGGTVARNFLNEEEVDLAFKIGFNRPATSKEISTYANKVYASDVLSTILANNVDFRTKAAQYDALKKQLADSQVNSGSGYTLVTEPLYKKN